jgi:mannose-1-phosphate guanylyltransferase
VRHAVVLAGGAGTRLWPASRRLRPKQFLALGGAETLLAATVRRARGAATGDVVVVTAADQVDLVREGAPGVAIVAEPVARNTAAALGLAAVHLLARDRDAVIGAMPADHHIADEAGWARVVERAFTVAERSDAVCTVGVVPTRADTGFGYLELGASLEADLGVPGVRAVARFVEKPDARAAAGYLTDGRHLWNAGMFFVKARRLLDDIERFLPETGAALAIVAAALESGPAAASAEAARVYPALPSVSIDHGVMEKAAQVVTVPGDFGWSDIGSWSALASLAELASGDGGNTVLGDGVVVDGTGNVVVAESGVVAVVGCSDLVVVRSGDAVLVIPRERSQDVRRAVEALVARHLERYL